MSMSSSKIWRRLKRRSVLTERKLTAPSDSASTLPSRNVIAAVIAAVEVADVEADAAVAAIENMAVAIAGVVDLEVDIEVATGTATEMADGIGMAAEKEMAAEIETMAVVVVDMDAT